MRRLLVFLICLAFLSAVASQSQASIDNAFGGGTGGNTLVAWGTNALTVVETITPASASSWQYTYTFTNTDTSPIYDFALYTQFSTFSVASTFPIVTAAGYELDEVIFCYDARNIDPLLTTLTGANYDEYGASDNLAPGSTGSLSFVANTLDTNPKLFAYETLASGYAGGQMGVAGSQDMVAAIGYTEGALPEPSTVIIWSVLGLLGISVGRLRGRSA
ncbi:MAG: hypothetical protein JW888_06325 [Pirellulales bacterium]|nr:hypothetical protein [Pirellulales bacterium]